MPKVQDYECRCGKRFEYMHRWSDVTEDPAKCPVCGETCDDVVIGKGAVFKTIVPTHRTSKKSKAGYVHSHADRPAEKGSVAVPSNKGNF